jgi:hypothetical protein
MIAFVLTLVILGAGGATLERPMAIFVDERMCELTAKQLKEHPENNRVADFYCQSYTDV